MKGPSPTIFAVAEIKQPDPSRTRTQETPEARRDTPRHELLESKICATAQPKSIFRSNYRFKRVYDLDCKTCWVNLSRSVAPIPKNWIGQFWKVGQAHRTSNKVGPNRMHCQLIRPLCVSATSAPRAKAIRNPVELQPRFRITLHSLYC